MSDVFYLYGFVGPDVPSPPDDLGGLEGRPIEELEMGAFRAIFARLPAEAYSQDVVSERVKELGWVGTRGLLHERVVTWFVDHGGVVPARFLTLYSSLEALESESRRRSDRIERAIERFAGLTEWNLKVSYDPDRLDEHLGGHSAEIRELDARIASAAPGRQYLLERKRKDISGRISREVAESMARSLLEMIGELPIRIEVVPLPRDVEGPRAVLSAALLVPPDQARPLREQVDGSRDSFAAKGIEVELTGPWAPYRFIEIDEKQDQATSGGMG